MSAEPRPVLPDYNGACVRGVVPALLAPSGWRTTLPSWMPGNLESARSVVILVVDGLGWNQLRDRPKVAPTLTSMEGQAVTTVAPSTTATGLSSISTGLAPAEHGLVGYRIAMGREVLNVLRWSVEGEGRRHELPPASIQPIPAFLGNSIPVVVPNDLAGSAFSEAHLAGAEFYGCSAPSSIPVEIEQLVRSGERVVYAYYGELDRTAHGAGFGPFYDAELRAVDRMVAEIVSRLPGDAALLVTSDHGQVHVGDNVVHPSQETLAHVSMQSGEGRFRWFHAKPGQETGLYEALLMQFSDSCWVRTKAEIVDEGWFGPVLPPTVSSRLGDVAVVPHEPISLYDTADQGHLAMVCRHGSLTEDEMLVPLLAGLGAM